MRCHRIFFRGRPVAAVRVIEFERRHQVLLGLIAASTPGAETSDQRTASQPRALSLDGGRSRRHYCNTQSTQYPSAPGP